jgi:ABC-2 type transport system ATP-binding protein
MLTVTHLTKSFGAVRAVNDLSFTVEPGEVTGFLGPNGAGKTTTLRMLLGLVRPDAGSALVGGVPYADLAEPVRSVGAVLEATAFHPGRTARVHLRALCLAAGLPSIRVEQALDDVDLTAAADRRVGGFSLGMRQRLALASALLGDPTVLILDEPANGLDPVGIHWLRGFLRALAADGRTVLLSSHLLVEMEQTAARVLIIDGGRLVADRRVAELADGLERTYLELVAR